MTKGERLRLLWFSDVIAANAAVWSCYSHQKLERERGSISLHTIHIVIFLVSIGLGNCSSRRRRSWYGMTAAVAKAVM